jgi:uncharacterized protein with PQ loop repeat
MLSSVVATLAIVLNCIQQIPQVHKTFSTKSVKDISLYHLLLVLSNNLLWLLHGYLILDISLIVACAIGAVFNVVLLALYHLYSK